MFFLEDARMECIDVPSYPELVVPLLTSGMTVWLGRPLSFAAMASGVQ